MKDNNLPSQHKKVFKVEKYEIFILEKLKNMYIPNCICIELLLYKTFRIEWSGAFLFTEEEIKRAFCREIWKWTIKKSKNQVFHRSFKLAESFNGTGGTHACQRWRGQQILLYFLVSTSPPSPPPHKHAFVLLQILFTLTLVIAGHQNLNLQHPCHARQCQVLWLNAYFNDAIGDRGGGHGGSQGGRWGGQHGGGHVGW